jgi:tripeptide aminopeptidase
MNKEFLKEVLSIPSYSKKEILMREFIKKFAIHNGIEYHIDYKGNIYLTKGVIDENEYYPCVVSHIDTVHNKHISLIEENKRLIIDEDQDMLTAKHPETNIQTGIGGDDKCGVFVCLSLMTKLDVIKGAFFVEEEIGMLGSKVSDDNFFKNVGYAIQFDAPSANWITEVCSGVRIFEDFFKDMIKEVLSDNGYTNFSNDPFTDVNQLAQKYDFNCLNLGCGYYRQHTDYEYVIISEVERSLKAGLDLIEYLGNDKYIKHREPKREIIIENQPISYNVIETNDFEDNNFDLEYVSEELTKSIYEIINEGGNENDVKKFIYDFLSYN